MTPSSTARAADSCSRAVPTAARPSSTTFASGRRANSLLTTHRRDSRSTSTAFSIPNATASLRSPWRPTSPASPGRSNTAAASAACGSFSAGSTRQAISSSRRCRRCGAPSPSPTWPRRPPSATMRLGSGAGRNPPGRHTGRSRTSPGPGSRLLSADPPPERGGHSLPGGAGLLRPAPRQAYRSAAKFTTGQRTSTFVATRVPWPWAAAAMMSSSLLSSVGVTPGFQVKIWRFQAPPW